MCLDELVPGIVCQSITGHSGQLGVNLPITDTEPINHLFSFRVLGTEQEVGEINPHDLYHETPDPSAIFGAKGWKKH